MIYIRRTRIFLKRMTRAMSRILYQMTPLMMTMNSSIKRGESQSMEVKRMNCLAVSRRRKHKRIRRPRRTLMASKYLVYSHPRMETRPLLQIIAMVWIVPTWLLCAANVVPRNHIVAESAGKKIGN